MNCALRVRACCVAVACVLTLCVAPQAQARIFHFPFFFPIADCGTINAVGTVDISGEVTVECMVWDADSGGRYTFAGVETYDVGDRVFVQGGACFVCLTTCPATPLINSSHMPCLKP